MVYLSIALIFPKEENICKKVVFVGKEMNYKLGVWIREQGFRGAFPWAANYDSNQFNNSLVNWLNWGLKKINNYK